jgi:hypothetical protein
MPARVRMSGGVAVWRAVTAKRRAAFLTRPQMHPSSADLHTLFALPAFRMFDGSDHFEMRTTEISHHRLPFIHAALDKRRPQQSSLRRPPMPHA